MIRILATVFAALLGLAFGSFLNVCLSRWPQDESVIKPHSHCRKCDRTLAWRENVPLLSWLILRGRCRGCKSWISVRYPLVEAAVGVLWAILVWRALTDADLAAPATIIALTFADLLGQLAFYWLLVALALLDAENLWLPDWLTLPGTLLGFVLTVALSYFDLGRGTAVMAVHNLLSILAAAGLILVIRCAYWLIRRQEGIGLGDAKLMAMLAAWLGLRGALLAFGLGVVMGAVAGLSLLCFPAARRREESWALSKLPLGTFLCIGAIVSGLWGESILRAYLHWAGIS